jgi:catechol 2,3-dioxygenase-like lactoylglutathione lyase family enzyme
MENIVAGLLTDFERGRMSRRDLIRNLTVTAAATVAAAPAIAAPSPIEGKGFKAVAVNHLSYGVADYGRSRDFYADLLGMKVSHDTGKDCILSFGETLLILRKSRQPDSKPLIDHVSYTIANWDKAVVEEELKRRGHKPTPDTEFSFHIKDPDGFDLQIEGDDVAQYR